jgi:hypothetical protein
MLHGIDNDSHVAAPYNQVSRLRPSDTSKVVRAVKQPDGVFIAIRESGAVVDVVHKVGAILLQGAIVGHVHGGAKYRKSLVQT